MSESFQKTVDLDRILAEKMGNKARWIPTFVRNWLKRIVHEEQVNQFLWDSRHLTGTAWLTACVRHLDMDLQVEGLEHLPQDGRRLTFVSNHPLGGPDGVALGSIIGQHYGDNYRYLLNDLLLHLPALKAVGVGINKTGSQGRDFPRRVEQIFASPHHVILFPAGLCSRRQGGVVRDLPWRKTFVVKSVEHQRDVVPVFFSGHNSDRFYRLANLCQALHLKVNVAMLFLADEMYRNAHKSFRVVFGRPIPWQTFDHSRTPQQWAQWVQDEVYKL